MFEEEQTLFADVLLPVPIPGLFTYRIPRALVLLVEVGHRVVVPFGKGRVLTAIVVQLHATPPKKYQAKYITEVLDSHSLVTRQQLALFQWIAEYYLCYPGEVLNVALPSGLKVTSQSRVQYNPDFDYDHLLTEPERIVLEVLKKQDSLTYDELARLISNEIAVSSLLKSLINKHAIILFEEIKEKYKPKIIQKIRFTDAFLESTSLSDFLQKTDKKPKQQAILLTYLSHVPVHNNPNLNTQGLDKSLFTQSDALSDSALQTLIRQGVFEQFSVSVSRFDNERLSPAPNLVLSPQQQIALNTIKEQFEEKSVVLLHGVTGSGKTEVYIRLIQEALEAGSQVLFLLPEIALTTQIVVRLRKIFGEQMGIYHSKFSDNERVEVWKGIIEGRFQFVVGVRSAIFLPFDRLGLIIVDEEHETSYKQFDPAPRYHARDVAVMMAYMQGAKTLLGSATPSLESYHHALNGRYGLVNLHERYGQARLPEFILVDIRTEKKQRKMKEAFSSMLLDYLELTLQQGEQSILFQNRRGYSPYLQCEECAHIAECAHCAVSLTYHHKAAEMRCHYCGYKEEVPRTCPTCGSPKVKTVGYGTEKLEDQLLLFFPEAKVLRMDLDTTRAKNAYQDIIGAFERGEVDILVGTQMISKGLDFDNVSLVGVFDADRIIHFPDFRASERAFQMITQVSGRAGRRADKPGKVLIQTANPAQRLLQQIIDSDYTGMYQAEIVEREKFHYPPFTRLIRLIIKHTDDRTALRAAQLLAQKLTESLGTNRVLGPQPSLVERIRNQFLFEVLIKLEREKTNFKAVKQFIQEKVTDVLADKSLKNVRIVVDVDPM